MSQPDPWFYRLRSVACASLALTKSGEARVQSQAGPETEIGLLVELLRKGKSTLRIFAVRIIAGMDLPSVEEAESQLPSQLRREAAGAALPLCVFLIGVRQPEGLCRWLVEPVVEDGQASLRRNPEPTWQPLDDAVVNRLLAQVNTWYDALNGPSEAEPRGRTVKSGTR
jgi:hypothetical protein